MIKFAGEIQKFKAIFTLFIALTLGIIFIPIGVLFNIGNSIVNIFKFRLARAIKVFIDYWKYIIYQLWNTLYYLWFQIALSIDYLGNVFCGKLIGYLIVSDIDWYENNMELLLFGRGRVTLSAAIGQIEFNNKINNFGVFLSRTLNFAFNEENHCLAAYVKWSRENNRQL